MLINDPVPAENSLPPVPPNINCYVPLEVKLSSAQGNDTDTKTMGVFIMKAVEEGALVYQGEKPALTTVVYMILRVVNLANVILQVTLTNETCDNCWKMKIPYPVPEGM